MRYKYWVLIAVGLFITGLVLGLVVSAVMPADMVGLLSEELSTIEELAAVLAPFQATTAVFIFFKNLSVLLFSFIFSPILCLLPALALVLNGTIISLFSVMVIQEVSAGLLLAGLLPHGIFEIPAIIIGEAAALSFGAAIIAALLSRERRDILVPRFKQCLRYLLLATILLVPAAIMETFVTPLLLQ